MTRAAPTLLVLELVLSCRLNTDSPVVAAAQNGDTWTLQQLIEKGAEVNRADHQGITALNGAARLGQVESIRLLIAKGADPNLHDGRSTGWNPLMHAIHKNQLEAVVALLEAGANVNDRSASGITPLMMAAGYGQTQIVEILLAHGADTKAETTDGVTALSGAVGEVADIDLLHGRLLSDRYGARNPQARPRRPPLGRAARRVRLIARLGDCYEVLRRVDRRVPAQRS